MGEIPGSLGESNGGGVGDEFRDEVWILFAKKNFPVLGWCVKGGGAFGFVLRASLA